MKTSSNLKKLMANLLSEATSYEDFIGDTAQPMTNEEEPSRNDKILDILISAKKLGLSTDFDNTLLKVMQNGDEPEDILVEKVLEEIRNAISRHLSELNKLDIEINSLVGIHSSSEESTNF
jgi:hypothetical protein